jgi:hypothetical protein
LAVAIAATAGLVSQAQEQPIPPPATDNSLPPCIQPGSPVAEVVKLVQAGTELGVVKNFIANQNGSFDLDTEQIVALTDLGVPAELVNAMMAHDKMLSAPPPAAPVATVTAPTTDPAPPTAEITPSDFNTTLTPYGSWVEVEGYGRCWRPTVVVYDSSWQPYRERGHWVYSDCGWYWDSDYSWGVTFHYGRWFQHARWGWCWWPDTVWAPSWVTWRSSDAYCGWAPLPPFAVYRPGGGFYYRGASVSVGFDFGLSAACFTFISPEHFCAPHPRYYCVEPRRNVEIYHQTTIINNFSDHRGGNHRDVVVNGGISIDHINRFAPHPVQPVRVGEIHNAARQGWRGNDSNRNEPRPNNGSPGGNGGRNFGGSDEPAHHSSPLVDSRPNHNESQPRPITGQPVRPDRAQNGPPVSPNQGATAATFNRADQAGRTADGQNHNRTSAAAGSVILTGPPKVSSPPTPAMNNQSENRWNNQPAQSGSSIPLGNNSGATAATFNRAERDGRTVGGQNHNQSLPSGGAPLGNNFGATAGSFNRGDQNTPAANSLNNNRPASPARAPGVAAPARVSPPQSQSQFQVPERSVSANNPPPNRSNERVAVTAPVRLQPSTPPPSSDQRSQSQPAAVGSRSEPRQSVAASAPARTQPVAPTQPQSSGQSPDRSSGSDKDRQKH